MKIMACISRVPDTATKIVAGADGKHIDSQGVKFVVNPYDEFALEEALRIKEKFGGEVIAVTVGTESAKDVLRTAYAMGATKATLIKTENPPEDSFFAAKNLAEYAKTINPDIILMGRQSVDYDSKIVPAAVAEFLNIPAIYVVSKLEVEEGKVKAERDIVGGKEIIESELPCVISAQKGLNEPRYPKLPDIMKAKSKPIEEIEPVEFEDTQEILEMSLPSKKRVGKIMGAEDSDIDELVRALKEDAKII